VKKVISITFIFLAIFFCSKDIILLSVSSTEATSFIADLNEEESSEKSEKGEIKEKDSIEEWQQYFFERLCALETTIETSFFLYKEKRSFAPYFEICSPPPELV